MLTKEMLLAVLLVAAAQCMAGVVKRSDDADPLEAVVQTHSTHIAQLQAKLDALTDAVSRHVAFLVQLSRDEDIYIPAPASGPYKFTRVLLNDGNGYDPITGIFTAPYPGVYAFAMQIFLHNAEYAYFDIKVNSNIVARMAFDTRGAGTFPHDSDSTSVTVKLHAGDKVWVESGSGAHTLIAEIHTFFHGYLLYTN